MKNIVIGTAGHIDHGKSALVKALTGTDPDRLKEEQARGITIDLGFAHTAIGDLHVAFVDVPGHERFVRNMLAGVGGIDAVMLVVAADESVMPQTREHFEICRLLQVPSGLIALTKADLADADMLELARLEVCELVRGSFLESAAIVPVSSRTGAGLDSVRAAILSLGRTVAERRATGAVRLPVDRVFSMRGFGTVVTGTLVSGEVTGDHELLVVPRRRPVKVRGVQVHGHRVPSAIAGQRVALNLGGVEVSEIARGDQIVSPETFEATRSLDAVIETLANAPPLRHGARVRFHQGTVEAIGRVSVAGILARPGPESAGHQDDAVRPVIQGARDATVPGGRGAHVRLRLESDVVVTRGDRFILRAYSPPTTIAGGIVIDPRPPRIGVRTTAGRERFARLGDGQNVVPADAAARKFVEELAVAGLPISSLTSRVGLSPGEAGDLVRRLERDRTVAAVGGVLIATETMTTLRNRLIETLTDFHRAQPLADGMSREELRERVFSRADAAVFDTIVNDLVVSGVITGRDRLALATHRVELSPDEQRARDVFERAFADGGLLPPEPLALAERASVPPAVGQRIVGLLVRQKVLVKIDSLLFHRTALERLKQEIAAMKGSGGKPVEIEIATFKGRYGVTRKFAIPLLEYLDRERVTRRVGDRRIVI